MPTIFVLLDAFRRDYLSADLTPFLWRCAQEGEHYEGVRQQSLGFCERSEILTGLRGDETGFFAAIGFDPIGSPYAGRTFLSLLDGAERAMLPLFRLLPADLGARAHRRLRSQVGRMFSRRGITMPTYFIPYSWLPYFALTEDRVDHRRPDAFPKPSILTLLESAGKSYCYETFTALGYQSPYHSDRDRLEAVVGIAREAPRDLYLVYVAAPDAYGHRYGPGSAELADVLRALDGDLEEFVDSMEGVAAGNRYVFLGDHGMLPVQNRVDAEQEIRRLLAASGLRTTSDVVYFLDSTMVRFWAMSNRARARLPGALGGSDLFAENGSWMDADRAARDHVPWPDRRYGDHLWIADPGVLVFPDFFHRLQASRGMHGYDPRLPQSQGMCIHWGQGIGPQKYSSLPLTDVFHVLKRSLDI